MSFSSSTEQQSLAAIRQRTKVVPQVAVVLGSGLADLTRVFKQATVIAYDEIPFFPKLTSAGHVGELVVGYIEETPVVAMRGRAHLYEGHSPFRATYGIRLMQAMGAHTLAVSNAAGGLNPRYQVGELVLIDGHIDLIRRPGRLHSMNDKTAELSIDIPVRSGPIYDPALIARALACARQQGHALERGTYLATLGPTYETRAEYRAFRLLGADMVGMSTVPETILAATLGMKVIAFSVITNIATPDSSTMTTHQGVLEAAHRAQRKLTGILQALLNEMNG